MSNLADLIEEYILRRLSAENNDIVIFRRNDIADKIDCAPSQISYVLNTRFTIDRGFKVESRRGSGGFIRIARIPLQNIIYQDIAQQMTVQTSFDDMEAVIRRLVRHSLISSREAALLMLFATVVFDKVKPEERAPILRSVFLTLTDFA